MADSVIICHLFHLISVFFSHFSQLMPTLARELVGQEIYKERSDETKCNHWPIMITSTQSLYHNLSITICPLQSVHHNLSTTICPPQSVHHNQSPTIRPPQLVYHNLSITMCRP